MAATRDEQSSGALFCARCGTLMDVEVAKHAVVCGMCGAARSFSGATPGLRHAAAQQR
jgi:DNA-directed RNA polymerase subunit M/transcription elongation factor TFIIS